MAVPLLWGYVNQSCPDEKLNKTCLDAFTNGPNYDTRDFSGRFNSQERVFIARYEEEEERTIVIDTGAMEDFISTL